MKQYPLLIEAICGDDGWTYFSKGHHEPAAFAKALAESGEVDEQRIVPEALTAEKLHKWFRRDVRNPRDGYSGWYLEVPEGTRRAFPVTMVEDDDLRWPPTDETEAPWDTPPADMGVTVPTEGDINEQA